MVELYPSDFFEVLNRHGIGTWPAALDVINTEVVERVGDAHLVIDGEVEILGLGAIS